MRGNTIKGHLDLLLLAVLKNGPAHGYAVIEALRTSSEGAFDLAEGTIYPALHRLERRNLISSRWDRSNGRKRRVYSLTTVGRKGLRAQRAEWAGFARAIDAVVS